MDPEREPGLEEELEEELPADPEEDSEDSSEVSSGTTDIWEDPGPGFDPRDAPEDGEGAAAFTVRPGEEGILELEWDPKVVRGLLENAGVGIHGLVGKAQEDWVFTQKELGAISGPLTRILNRYPATAAAAAAGDEIAVLLGFGAYTARSLKERKAAVEAAALVEEMQASQAPGMPPVSPPAEEVFYGAAA